MPPLPDYESVLAIVGAGFAPPLCVFERVGGWIEHPASNIQILGGRGGQCYARCGAMSADYEAEIRLAERGFHVLMERIALKRMPADALPTGDVYRLLDAAGEQLEIQALQDSDKKVSKRRLKKATRELVSAIEDLIQWPEEPRLQVASELVATLRTVELASVAENLLVALQQAAAPADDEATENREAAVEPPITPLEMTQRILDSGRWTTELDDLLRQLRQAHLENPDDEALLEALKRGIVFNAVSEREHLLLEERRRLAETELLPDDLAQVLVELPTEILSNDLSRLGLHLVLADVVAAGLVPEKTSPEMTVAATLAAMLRADEPGKRPDINALGDWAGANPLKIDVLSDDIAPVFKWLPEGDEGSAEQRHEKRWKVESLMYQFLPARWIPGRGQELPRYSKDVARERLEKLRPLAWLMIDEIEAVRFVSESFSFGNGAPDSMDLDLVNEIIELWGEQAVVKATEEFGRAYLEDEWTHEIPDDETEDASIILPAATTSDGEPLILSTVVFTVAEGTREEIVELLDDEQGYRRGEGGAGDSWDWFGPSKASTKVLAEITLEDDTLTVLAHSLGRASKTNAGLASVLGERIVLKDIRTEQPPPEALAELGIEMVGDAEDEKPDEEKVRVVHEVLEKHYRKWLDEPLPALDDMSPREAVDEPDKRPEVITLLLEAEERTRASSAPMNLFDFEFLWTELGLSRDEEN